MSIFTVEQAMRIALQHQQAGRLPQAESLYRQILVQQPNHAEADLGLGNVLKALGRVDEAIAAYRHAIAHIPDYGEAHWNLALALLTIGDFANGWNEYEWRWKRNGADPAQRNFTQSKWFIESQWDGRPLAGAKLLLMVEQGFGDTLQFIRYLPMVAQSGGTVFVLCQPELKRIIEPMADECRVLAHGDPLPACDLHSPLLSLPRVFQTTQESIPRQIPYLHADPAMVEQLRVRMAGHSGLLKVGLAWAGKRTHVNDRNRSMALSALAPLGRLPGIRFYSLQKGACADQAGNNPARLELVDWTNDLDDFSDTAALIANLDLVISVDTAVAHLAGAMGKSVWVMLPSVADWRWLLEREDSPWYPTMRLFRQTSPGDWDGVVRRIADALAGRKVLPGGMP